MGWWANPLNLPTRGGLSRVAKFLAHHKVSQVGFTHFQADSWWRMSWVGSLWHVYWYHTHTHTDTHRHRHTQTHTHTQKQTHTHTHTMHHTSCVISVHTLCTTIPPQASSPPYTTISFIFIRHHSPPPPWSSSPTTSQHLLHLRPR